MADFNRKALRLIWAGLFFSCSVLPLQAEEGARALSLKDCYQFALKQSESLRAEAMKVIELDEQYRQAFGALYPNLSFNASELFQDKSGDSKATPVVGERPELKFTLRQPIFTGFREFYTSGALEAQKRKANYLLKRNVRLLFESVAGSFYTVVQNETDLKNVQTLILLTQERIKELEGRIRLGKSRESEILTIQSQLASLAAQAEQIRGDIDTSRESLSLLLGVDMSSVLLSDVLPEVKSLDTEPSYVAKALSRMDVQAAREDVEASRLGLKNAKGALLPTAYLLGNYYTKRPAAQEMIDWDILLNLNIPIFEGGTTMARVREAMARLAETELTLAGIVRGAASEIRRNYVALRSSVQQSRALEEAFKKAEESYKLNAKEYRLGLVNNLDVIAAMNNMESAKMSWDRSLIRSKLLLLRLKVSTEELP